MAKQKWTQMNKDSYKKKALFFNNLRRFVGSRVKGNQLVVLSLSLQVCHRGPMEWGDLKI
ncbi:hypothetical protein CCACVL1_28192 [Corchorus capsularis]|uniref:Uncharacterized protein n=1 Tax=Corchorus capsularis TaxID=210143 RepID=A0A1R3G788_COCAP|nr:hypothetical protein CCACVL1_28192 [Corchorus capsularis]